MVRLIVHARRFAEGMPGFFNGITATMMVRALICSVLVVSVALFKQSSCLVC